MQERFASYFWNNICMMQCASGVLVAERHSMEALAV